MEPNTLSLTTWNNLMGKDRPWPIWQPIVPVMVEDGEVKLGDLAETLQRNFSEGATIGFLHACRRNRRRHSKEG